MRKLSIGPYCISVMCCISVIGVFTACYNHTNGVAAAASAPLVFNSTIAFAAGAEAEPPDWPAKNFPALQKNAPPSLCVAGTSAAYPAPGLPPLVQSWTQADMKAGQIAADCARWLPDHFSTAIGLAGSFRYEGNAAGLLKRFAKVSSLSGVRYWSVTDKNWQTLITAASALRGPEGGPNGGPRPDFTTDELKGGQPHYFTQKDNRSPQPITYSIKIDTFTPKTLVVSITNVSSLKFLFIPVLKPGDIQSVYIIERLSPGVWNYFSLLGVRNSLGISSVSQRDSWINRAMAIYGHFTGAQPDKMSQLARERAR